MKSSFSFLAARLAIAAACFFFCAGLISAQSLPGYRAPDTPKPKVESLQTKAARGQAPLRKLYDHLRPEAAKSKHLPPLNAREKRRRLDKLLQIGVVRTLPFALDPVTDSAEYSTAEGGVKVASVVSEGARYVRLHFKNFSLPAGARVFVYSAANPDFFFGPYEGRGPWSDGTF